MATINIMGTTLTMVRTILRYNPACYKWWRNFWSQQPPLSPGPRLTKYLHENFQYHFTEELSGLPGDGLRRTFLALNKDLATTANQTVDWEEHQLYDRTPSYHTSSSSSLECSIKPSSTQQLFTSAKLFTQCAVSFTPYER
ncbi:hypothetical protein JMJ35_000048 [Cladonia borealis]|uniref:Uncharacterized protein n=1 Tax=Cladonia borealis TaxID=184061 RepID=A0AA39RB35_9LECA|nr:hypothetical protein JMJ35_000048 [Cladonia borealis]